MGAVPDNVIGALMAAEAGGYDDARAMPGAFYLSADVLDLETRHLFRDAWTCVGRADEIPSAGDYLTYDILDEPVVAIRGEDGEVRALSNVCRHRAMPLLKDTGRAKRLVCPYHAWTYDSTGQLIGAPHIADHPTFDKRECRLPQFACEVWHGFIFVNTNPDAASISDRLEPLSKRIAPYHFEDMQTRFIGWEVWNTNWKLLVENFMEGYHLTHLHARGLGDVTPTGLCEHFEPGDGYFGYNVGFAPGMNRKRIGHADLTREQIDTCVMAAVTPNLLIGGASDACSFLCVEPKTPETVRVRLAMFFHEDYGTDEDIDWSLELFDRTMAEDKIVLNELGRGLRSAHYTPGPLAPAAFEGCVRDLHRYVAGKLLPVVAA